MENDKQRLIEENMAQYKMLAMAMETMKDQSSCFKLDGRQRDHANAFMCTLAELQNEITRCLINLYFGNDLYFL